MEITERTISRIEAPETLMPLRKKVAGYARVSSGKDAMLHSLAAQVHYYSSLIHKHSDWEYVGVYADEALTGTKESRPEFQRLLSDCRKGKVDLILTKSLSRFARNTVTTLKIVRELRILGVDIWFERENIHTNSSEGEFMLTVLASVAQEESLSTSENQKWKIRKNFKEGRPTSTTMMGYKLVGDTFVIIPEEADIVRMIFSYYLSGMGLCAIAKKLNELSIPSKHGGKWHESVISKMLRNEKYIGDLLLQKTFIADHISKKKIKNVGQLPQYAISDAHEAIVDKDIFQAVQNEIARRVANRKPVDSANKRYPFSGKIVCGQCGAHYRRKITAAGTKYERAVWICATYNRLGKSHCASQQIPEAILIQTVGDTVFEEIRVPQANTIIIVQPDGTVILRHWQNPSRAESWTEEMKAEARERRLQWQNEQ